MKVLLFLTSTFSLILIGGSNFHGGQDNANSREGNNSKLTQKWKNPFFDKLFDFSYDRVIINISMKGCPLGYIPEDGTVTEKGLVGEYVASLNKCAEDCKLRGNCYAFTHSAKKQTCVLLENDEPTMGNWKDEQFCKKVKGGGKLRLITLQHFTKTQNLILCDIMNCWQII